MSDSLTEFSKKYGSYEEGVTSVIRSHYDFEDKQRVIRDLLTKEIYAILRVGEANGIEQDAIEIILSHKRLNFEYHSYNVREALGSLLHNHKFPRATVNYKHGYYLERRSL